MSKGRDKKKKKILWVSDAVATTGFSRVAHNIIKFFPRGKYEIHHLGINYSGDPHGYKHHIYPAVLGGDLYGTRRLEPLIKQIKPDLLFFLNDAWVINQYLQELVNHKLTDIPVVVYFPVDSEESDADWFRHYHLVYATCVYTEFAKRDIIASGAFTEEDNINIIPHGVDTEKFYPHKNVNNVSGLRRAKQEMFPWKERPEFLDSFVVLNANRNQPRKRVDLTLRAFGEFVKDKKGKTHLYCHMGIEDAGINLLKVAKRYNFDDYFIVSSLKNQIPGVPDSRLNLIYNACDVGINTSSGEGWGLVSFEHAATRRAQIVPNHSGSAEIWSPETAIMIEGSEKYMYEHTNTVATMLSYDSTLESLETAYEMWQDGSLVDLADAAYNHVTQPKYKWKTISRQVDKVFNKILR